MFTKLISFFLCLSILSVSASAATPGLKAAFNELNYSLNVEWDQQDQKFYQQEMQRFNQTIESASTSEVMALLKSELKDQQLLSELAGIMIQSMSHDEAALLVRSMIERSYQQGASWQDQRDVPPVLTVMILVILVINLLSRNLT